MCVLRYQVASNKFVAMCASRRSNSCAGDRDIHADNHYSVSAADRQFDALTFLEPDIFESHCTIVQHHSDFSFLILKLNNHGTTRAAWRDKRIGPDSATAVRH